MLSKASAVGRLSWAVVAAAVSPEKPAVPVPATVVMIWVGLSMRRMRWLWVSAM